MESPRFHLRFFPTRRPLWSACLYVGISLGTSGCLFKKQPRAFNPPPIPSKPAPVIPPVDYELPEAGVWEVPVLAELPANPNLPSFPAPPVPAPPKRPPVASAPKQTIPAPNTEPQPETMQTPRLGQVFTAEQVREYARSYDDSLASVRRQVDAIEKKRLNAEQAQTLESIRAFQKQAEQAREQDLLTAVNLARRADLLAKDLLGRLP